MNNFIDAIQEAVPLETPLSDSHASVALANAMLLSAWEDRRVSLPLDEQAYEQALASRVAGSSLREAQQIDVHIDMEDSYR